MFKKFLRNILNLLFISTTITFIFAVTAIILLQPRNIKRWVQKSGAYTTLPNTLIDQAAVNQAQSTSDISLSNPIVTAAAKDTITANFVQNSSEQIIDGVFAWLNGNSPAPSFSIDLIPIKQSFADKIVVATKDRYSKLPECKPGTFPRSSNPLTIECRPLYGIDINKVTEDLRKEIILSKDFFPENTITSKNVFGSESTSSVFNSKAGPQIFQSIKKAPFFLGGLLLLYAGGIIALYSPKRKGVNRVGALLILSAVLGTISIWLTSLTYSQYQDKIQIISIGTFSNIVMPVIDAFRFDALKYTGIVAVFIAIIGIVILALGAITQKRTDRNNSPSKESKTPTTEKPLTKIPTETNPPKPKNAPKVKMIQPKQQEKPTIITPTPSTAPEVVNPSKKRVQ